MAEDRVRAIVYDGLDTWLLSGETEPKVWRFDPGYTLSWDKRIRLVDHPQPARFMLEILPNKPQWRQLQWSVPEPLHLPELVRNGVQVWRVDLDCPDPVRAELYAYLSADERDRATRFKFDPHRHHFVVGRGFLRLILAAYTGQPPACLSFGYGDRGKPFLSPLAHSSAHSPTLHFNVSHSGGVAVYGVSGDRPVGIDVEAMRPMPNASDLAQRFFSAEEYKVIKQLPPSQQAPAFFRGWTRKEAYLKATGTGLVGLETIGTAVLTPESARHSIQMTLGKTWWLRDIDVAHDHVGAIAMAQPNLIEDAELGQRIDPPDVQFFYLIPA